MTSRLEKRVLRLERAKNPPMGIEYFLSCLDDDSKEFPTFAPGENAIFDFLTLVVEEEFGQPDGRGVASIQATGAP